VKVITLAALTGRQTALEDVTVLSVNGQSVIGLFRNATFEVTSEEIDVTALRDSWKKREFGIMDWRMTCTNLVETSPKYLQSIISGGTILVSFASTGFNFLGTGMITGVPLNIDNPMTEEVTVLSAGSSPTISFT